MEQTSRRVWYWLAPVMILGAAYAGSVFADWLNEGAANTGDITREVLLWGVVAQALTVSLVTILLMQLEGPFEPFWRTHFRHCVLVYGFGFLFLLTAGSADFSHVLEYGAAEAAAAVTANGVVLWLTRRISRRVAA